MADASPLREERGSIYSPDSEDDKPAASSLDKRTCRAQPSQDTLQFRLLPRFRYSRLHDSSSKGKHLFQRAGALSTVDNIPLPFTKRDCRPGEEWIKGAVLCAWGSVAVLLINVVLAVIAVGVGYSKSSSDKRFSYAELYRGDCSVTDNWTIGMHLVINVLSTALLAASNYVMQCLSAPSRTDVDRAHSRRTWLDIGTFSARNFFAMGAKRKVLWVLLLVSSLPIHLMYNSAVFSSISAIGYGTVLIPNDLGRNESLVKDSYAAESFRRAVGYNPDELQAEIFNGTLQNLTLAECVKKYNVEYNTGRSTLLLVADRRHFYNFSSLTPATPSPYDGTGDKYIYADSVYLSEDSAFRLVYAGHWNYPEWSFDGNGSDIWLGLHDLREKTIRGRLAHDTETLSGYILSRNPGLEDMGDFLNTASNWEHSSWAAQLSFRIESPSDEGFLESTDYGSPIPRFNVSHCMTKNADQHCQFYFSLPICLTVIACNIVKVSCMYMAARTRRREVLLTVGDSLSSFLENPDATTEGRCFMSYSDMARGLRPWRLETALTTDTIPLTDIADHGRFPQPTSLGLLPRRKWWAQAASGSRWTATIGLFLACLAASLYLYYDGGSLVANDDNFSPSDGWDLGIGTTSSRTMIVPGQNVIALVLLANTPQLLFSTLYLLCNGLLTSMLAVAEYNDFATQRKPLRVSWPKGQQRSTYYLSLPYRYGIPLITVSIAMHWLLSQCIFLAKVNAFDGHGHRVEEAAASNRVQPETGCGYSPLATFIAMIAGATAMGVLVLFGLRRLRSNMPLASSCSAAISAACHPHPGDTDASLKPVKWGEVQLDSGNDQNVWPSDTDGVNSQSSSYAHCTFTSKDVVTPSMIRLYC